MRTVGPAIQRSTSGLRAATVALLAGIVLVSACGDDDGAGAAASADPGASVEVLSDEDQSMVTDRLVELSNAQVQEHQDVSGGGYDYSPADRFVVGYPSEYQTPLERCQELADALGELDGPPGTVPVQIVESRDDGTGDFDVLAGGAAGGACEEG